MICCETVGSDVHCRMTHDRVTNGQNLAELLNRKSTIFYHDNTKVRTHLRLPSK